MSLLVERKAESSLAGQAVTHIEETTEVLPDGGHAPLADLFEYHLPLAEARVAQLCGQD